MTIGDWIFIAVVLGVGYPAAASALWLMGSPEKRGIFRVGDGLERVALGLLERAKDALTRRERAP